MSIHDWREEHVRKILDVFREGVVRDGVSTSPSPEKDDEVLGMGGQTIAVRGEAPKDPDSDPWKHRSKGMRCSTCVFYVPKEPSYYVGPKEIGRCRRNAPTMRGFPAVFPIDWCGEHRLDENKLT